MKICKKCDDEESRFKTLTMYCEKCFKAERAAIVREIETVIATYLRRYAKGMQLRESALLSDTSQNRESAARCAAAAAALTQAADVVKSGGYWRKP